MVDRLRHTPEINPDLGSAAVIAASRFVAGHQHEIKKSLDIDFCSGRWLNSVGINRDIRLALDSPDPDDSRPHLATYLQHSSRFESVDGLRDKPERRRLPLSLQLLPELIDFYQSRVGIYKTAVASSLNRPYVLEQFLDSDVVEKEATRVVDMVGVTEPTGDIFKAALDTSPMLAEYYKHDRRSEVYFLLKHIKTRKKYQGYVEQLLDFSVPLSAPVETLEQIEESQDIAA